MSHGGLQVEGAISALTEMEKELDNIKEQTIEMRQKLLSLAREEAERARNEVVEQASKEAETNLEKVKVEAEEEATKIMTKVEEEVRKMKVHIDKVFDQAVDIVTRALLGD